MEDKGRKRKAGADGSVAAYAGQEEKEVGSARGELNVIKSVMQELLDQSRSQTTSMAHMQREMEGMREEMKMMRDEVTILSEKCDMKNTNSCPVEKETSIRDQMDARFGDVDDKLKYHEVLLKNQKWKYEDSPGYDDPLVGFEYHPFVASIRNLTCDMRHGQTDGTIDLAFDLANVDPYVYNDDGYDELFLSHWKQFTDALEEYQYTLKSMPNEKDTLLYISLLELELTPDVLELLDNTLQRTHFKQFRLTSEPDELDDRQDVIKFAISYLKT